MFLEIGLDFDAVRRYERQTSAKALDLGVDVTRCEEMNNQQRLFAVEGNARYRMFHQKHRKPSELSLSPRSASNGGTGLGEAFGDPMSGVVIDATSRVTL